MVGKKFLALGMSVVMTASLAACGSSTAGTTNTNATNAETTTSADTATVAETKTQEGTDEAQEGALTYAGITLGEDYTDITTTIKWLHHKTDREEDDNIKTGERREKKLAKMRAKEAAKNDSRREN